MVNGDGVVGGRQWRQIAGAYTGLQRRLDKPDNGTKSDLAGDERRHGHLVGRVVDRGGAATGPQRVVSEPKPREAIEIGSLEGQLSDLGKIKLCRRADDAIGPA